MTVGVDDELRIREYPGDNSATPRAYGFKILDPDDLRVTRTNADGSETVLVRGTHYSVSGSGNPTGGDVTPLAAIAAGTSWRIEGDMPLGQPTDYTAGDDFPAESHERGLDRSMIAHQEARRDLNDMAARALMVPRGESTPTLPPIAVRANQTLGFDAMGRPIPLTPGGADGALRADLAANGGVIVGTEGGSTAQDDINGIRGPYPVGAVGNGVTNDKAAIDAVNVAGVMVDLMGKTYAYTGTVDLLQAQFVNGVIVSSTMGTLDFRRTLVVGSRTISVGAAGDIKRLEFLMPYLRHLRILGDLTILLLEKNTPNDATGSMALNIADFYHPDMGRIHFTGPAFGGGQGVPAASALPGGADLAAARAADRAYLLDRFNASIYFTGTDNLAGSSGLNSIGGLSASRIYFENHTRYNAAVNWLGSHAAKTQGGGRISLTDCCLDGGVWTFTAVHTHVHFGGTRVLLAYPISGGGFFADHCTFYKNGITELHIYYPKVAPHSDMPQTGFTAKSCDFLFEPDGNDLNKVFLFGPFLHGLHLTDCTGQIPDVSFDGVSQPRTQVGGRIDYARPKVRNADPANTSLTVGSVQPGIIGNPVSRTLFFVSKNGLALYRGVDVAATVCQRYFVEESGGQNICGLNAKEDIDDSKATVKAYTAMASTGNIHRPNITNPRVGSIDGAEVLYGASMHLYDNAGVAPDITVNTLVKGNYISTP